MFKILIPFPTTSINFFEYHLSSLANSNLLSRVYHTANRKTTPICQNFPFFLRTCVRAVYGRTQRLVRKAQYRGMQNKRQGTTAMAIPCLYLFLLTVLRTLAAGTCRGEAPPSCCARPFCRLKAPLGLSLLRFAAQTRICSTMCRKSWRKIKRPLPVIRQRKAICSPPSCTAASAVH